MSKIVEDCSQLKIGKMYRLMKRQTSGSSLVTQVGEVFKLASSTPDGEGNNVLTFTSIKSPKWGSVNVVKFNDQEYSKKWFASVL